MRVTFILSLFLAVVISGSTTAMAKSNIASTRLALDSVSTIAPRTLNFTVEKFSATTLCRAELPGTFVNGGRAIQFAGAEVAVDVAFAQGATTINGVSIDFSGHEQAFLDSRYTGVVEIPNLPGSTVSGTLVGTVSGAIECTATATLGNMQLPGTFSERSPALEMGGATEELSTIHDQKSELFPGIEKLNLFVESTRQFVGMDLATGMAIISMEGAILSAGSVIGPDDGPIEEPDKISGGDDSAEEATEDKKGPTWWGLFFAAIGTVGAVGVFSSCGLLTSSGIRR